MYSLIRDSISLDIRTVLIKEWSLKKKIIFLIKKYFLLVKHIFKKFKLGEDFIVFDENKIYYNSRFGLAGYQRTICSHGDMLRKYVKGNKADVVFDIGANVGYFSMLCKERYPDAEIYSFEPIDQTFNCLIKNFENDRNIHPFKLGIMDFNGKSKMNFDEQESATASINEEGDYEIEVIKLDDFCENHKIKKIDILKIDTEKFENFVLAGAQNILKNVHYIILEVTIENNENYTISSLFKLLCNKEFNFQMLGFRNFSNKSEGEAYALDVIFENVLFSSN
jgi:FkbM family methyltransferase